MTDEMMSLQAARRALRPYDARGARGSGSNPRRTEPGGRTIEAGQDLGNVRTASTGLRRRGVTIASHQPDQDPGIVASEAHAIPLWNRKRQFSAS